MKKQSQNKTTELVSEVLKRSKKPLAMTEIVARVAAMQAKRGDAHIYGRRDIYNAVHNNAKSEKSLYIVSGEAVRGQHGTSNSMVYSLR